MIAVLSFFSCKLFGKGVTVEVIDISANAKLPAERGAELIVDLAYGSLHVLEMPSQYLSSLYNEGAFQETLSPVYHGCWMYR